MDDSLAARRIVCMSLWAITLVMAIAGIALEHGMLLLLSWGGAVTMLLVTVAVAKPRRDEQLVRPLLYRTTTGAFLGVALAGGLLALVPDASEQSRVFGAFFAVAAILAYRAVIARGPKAAMVAVAICVFTWIPFVAVTMVGCRCRKFIPPPHWTEEGSVLAMQVLVHALPVLAAIALFCFVPRDSELPEARAL